MSRFLSCFVLSLLLLGVLPAVAPAQEDKEKISLEVVSLVPGEVPDLFLRDAGGEYVPARIGRGSRGMVNEIPPDRSVTFFREVTGEDGAVTKVPALDIELPGGVERVLVFFFLRADGSVGSMASPGDGKGHVGRSARLINLTQAPMACRLGEVVVRLDPGEDKLVTDIRGEKDGFRFAFVVQEADGIHQYTPTKFLRFVTGRHRLTGVVAYERVVRETDRGQSETTYRPEAYRLWDMAPDAGDS